jgi:hypothetical protein
MASVTIASGAGANDKSEPLPAITYKLVQEVQPDPRWKVSIAGTGFARLTKPLRLRLVEWGGWPAVDGYYLRGLTAHPPLKPDAERRGEFVLETPASWDGTFEVCYTIPLIPVGSAVQQQHGLLPCSMEGNAGGFSVNTLMQVETGGRDVDISFRVVPPKSMCVATGWGGVTPGEQRVGLAAAMPNTPIVFGQPTGLRRRQHGSLAYEVAQFGPGRDRTDEVLRVARTVIPMYARHSGRPRELPVRVFLFDGATGATHTTSACLVSYRPDEQTVSPEFKHTIAHELFHDWLGAGGAIEGNETITWFHEGFTDYLSLWHCAAGGVVGHDWFAERLAAIDAEARRSSAYGHVAFAQHGVNWRSGANETLAYRGGAVLAFLVDVELRKQGRPGLMQLISDLGAASRKGPVSLHEIQEWMKRKGLGRLFASWVDGKELPPIGGRLAALGFAAEDAPADLTYFGIRVEQGRITALDPDGPAAKAGARVGDRIIGYFPTRPDCPRISKQVTTTYRFGLDTIEPGVRGTFIDVQRGKEELRLPVQPRVIPGGLVTRYVPDESRLRSFFEYGASDR